MLVIIHITIMIIIFITLIFFVIVIIFITNIVIHIDKKNNEVRFSLTMLIFF